MCHCVLVFFSPFSIAITSLGEERAHLSAFRTFVRFVLVWICRFPLPLGVWEGLRFAIVALPGLFSYLFFSKSRLRSSLILAIAFLSILMSISITTFSFGLAASSGIASVLWVDQASTPIAFLFVLFVVNMRLFKTVTFSST